MSYCSRVYRQRNPHTHHEGVKEPFFVSRADVPKSYQKPSFFQAKLSMNKPGDSYEREADAVANAVVNNQSSFATQNVGSIQKLRSGDERTKEFQKMESPLKEDEEKITQPVQAKQESNPITAPPHVSSKIKQTSGRGNVLPQNSLHEMNSAFGVDFSDVKVHHDHEAAVMNKQLHALAFTNGSDIYFNEGKYDPHSQEGKFLLAHELTHVVQQNPLSHVYKKDGDTRQATEKKYAIMIEKGDKDWSPGELALLYAALKTLSKDEATVLRKYRFIRWESKASRAKQDPSYVDPGADECGLHEADLQNGVFKISMYDACFSDPEAVSDKTAGIDTGEFHILHEIGHAMQQAELRNTNEAQKGANKKYNEAVDKYNKAGAAEQKRMKPGIDQLDTASNKAVEAMKVSEGRSLKDFEKLIEGKEALTEYSKTSGAEAFAEAFAIYKADPKGLKKTNRKVYDWFVNGGALKPVKTKK